MDTKFIISYIKLDGQDFNHTENNIIEKIYINGIIYRIKEFTNQNQNQNMIISREIIGLSD